MTQDEIIEMARQAGAMFDHMTWVERDLSPVFERFAKLVAAKAIAELEQRTWVGLTDDEISEWTPEIHGVIQAIEAKLKQKNGYAEEKNT